MIFGSVCSGIESASVAWNPLGWQAAFFSEIEKFPSAVLAHHYPDVPNYGDMTKFKEWPDAKLDVLVGGTPCQSFSVAGLRKGLADPRGNLMLTYLAIAARYRPEWLVWENVPGVLSSNGGRDFGTFLGGLGQLGYGFAYRILDAQFVGVPQRRRRVFVVGYLGDWRRAAAVLFERHSLSGNTPPSREKGKTAPTIPSRSTAGGGLGTDFDCDGGLIASHVTGSLTARGGRNGGQANDDVDGNKLICVATGQAGSEMAINMAPTLNCNHEAPYIAHSLRGEGFDASEDGTRRGTPLTVVPTLTSNGDAHSGYRDEHGLIPVPIQNATRGKDQNGLGIGGDVMFTLDQTSQHAVAFQSSQSGVRTGNTHATLDSNNGSRRHNGILQSMRVRRLTPKECARLQGFPDDYLDITFNGKPACDGPKYRALGNSMAVPCMAWIGSRISAVHQITSIQKQVAA